PPPPQSPLPPIQNPKSKIQTPTLPLHQTTFTQPALFALEYDLAQLWLSWGVQPAVMVGHSIGEYVAACLAGVFDLQDALRLVAARGRLMQALPADGAMLSVMTSEAQMQTLLIGIGERVAIAAINSPQSVVLSGREEAISSIADLLGTKGIKHTRLEVSHAFHSPLMAPMLAEFRQVAESVTYHAPKIPIVSTVTGEALTTELAHADYWVKHICQPVRFLAAMTTLHRQGYRTFLEIGAKPVLLGLGRACIPDADCQWLPSLRPGQSNETVLGQSLGEWYVQGGIINWARVFQGQNAKFVHLPTYPFQRQCYWWEGARVPSMEPVQVASPASPHHPLLGDRLPLAGTPEIRFQCTLQPHILAYLQQHTILHQPIFPGAAYGEMAIAAARQLDLSHPILQDLVIEQPLKLQDTTIPLQTVLTPAADGYSVQIFSQDGNDFHRHATATLCNAQRLSSAEVDLNQYQTALASHAVAVTDFYQILAAQGLTYGQAFQGIRQLWQRPGEALSQICLTETLRQDADRYSLHPVLLDACWQTIGAAVADMATTGTYLPVGLEALHFYQPLRSHGWCFVQVQDTQASNGSHAPNLKADLQVWDETGAIALQIHGMTLQFVSRASLAKLVGKQAQPESSTDLDCFYQLVWQAEVRSQESGVRSQESEVRSQESGVENPKSKIQNPKSKIGSQESGVENPKSKIQNLKSQTWLVFADRCGIAERLVAALRREGDRCLLVEPGETYAQLEPERYQINPKRVEDFYQLFHDMAATQEPLICQIVHLWSLDQETGWDFEGISSSNAEALTADLIIGCGSVLHLVQAISQVVNLSAQLWLVTQQAQAVGTPAPLQVSSASLSSASLWGLARTIRLEHPDLNCRCLDLDERVDDETLALIVHDLRDPNWEEHLAYRGGDRHVARLVPHDSPLIPQHLPFPGEPCRLGISAYGVLDNLTLMPAQRRSPQPSEVEIQVKAAGVNFRDVLNALGMLQPVLEQMGFAGASDVPFGGECAGTIVALGEGVTDFQIGESVIAAQAVGSLGQFVTVPAAFVVPKPTFLSPAAAATVPTTFLTAYYGLIELAKLKAGDRVLIHAAAGGVGQAVVQIAQWVGAEVFATASPGKWEYLRSQGITHVMNSRTLDFADEILAKTQGRGVDVVFNSLNGEVIDKNLAVLSPGGRFVEIGKIGIWSAAQAHQVRPDVMYHPFDLLEVSQAQPALIKTMLTRLMDLFQQGDLKPLPKTVFPITAAPDAFRYMAQAKHIGKVVMTLPAIAPSSPPIQPNATYLITGGLGALGLQLAQWLVQQGARHLILLGRRSPTPDIEPTLQSLRHAGATLHILQTDVTQFKDLQTTLTPHLPSTHL
ncbi:MAG: acyltransferase domain-containing protein, partial [Elainellaceae cyanobacterium]